MIEIGDSYREDYGALESERRVKELYPTTEEPTIKQLIEEEEILF